MDTKKEITHLFQEALQFNRKDVLVHLSHPHKVEWLGDQNEMKLPFDKSIQKFYLEAKQMEQERGSFPFCLGHGLLHWTWKDTAIQSPLFLTNCSLNFQKIDQTFQLQISEEWFLNPFLSKHFNIQFQETELEALQTAWNDHLQKFDVTIDIEDAYYIGNFHYHRYDLWRELDGLLEEKLNPNLNLILHGEKSKPQVFPFKDGQLFLLDDDQKQIHTTVQANSIVIQGPPGTGKSQIITQIMSDLLLSEYKGLIVSEKQVALKVLVQKMQHFQLVPFIHLINDAQSAKHFIQDLKATWHYVEQGNFNPVNAISLRKSYEQQLDQLLEQLKHSSILGGIDFQTFQIYSKNKNWEKVAFYSQMPDLVDWCNNKNKIQKIFDLQIQAILSQFKNAFWETNQHQDFDVKLRVFAKDWREFSNHFEIKTQKDFENFFKSALLFTDLNKNILEKYAWIVALDTNKTKKIHAFYKKFLQWEKAHAVLLQNEINWINKPSIAEINYFLNEFDNASFFTKRKWKKWWQKTSNAPIELATRILKNQLELYENEQVLHHLKVQLADWQIYEPAQELPVLLNFIAHVDQNALKELSEMSDVRKKALDEFSKQFDWWQQIFRTYFQFEEQTLIQQFFEDALSKWEEVLSFGKDWTALKKYLSSLNLANDFDTYEALLLKATWVKFVQHYPNFKDFKPQHLFEKALQINDAASEEEKIVVQRIQFQQYTKFNQYQSLLQSPVARLSEEDKALRKQLKNGKAILVKAFKRSRQFPSIRSLYKSDAKWWIDILKPILLANTSQVARHLPIDLNFDFGIFDEAGQIPLVNALGTLQRAQRIMIAGDTQQMSPSAFFQSQQETQIDLLHQSVYYLPQHFLTHHYRSNHPSLIAFSNKYFYHNKLQVYPSYPFNEQAVKGFYIADAVYLEGINPIEAKAIARSFSEALKEKDVIGLVAMSEHQLAEILRHIDASVQHLLSNRIEDGSCFFKTLEQVQGDECDRLWISFAYGKNKDGQFHQRFGPINLSTGPKRLNVLFSRAKEQINFYHSIHASEFQLSNNEGTQLLMKFIQGLETDILASNHFILPEGFHGSIDKQDLGLVLDYTKLKSANYLVSNLVTLSKRGWNIKI